jgi:thioredoxin-related protein
MPARRRFPLRSTAALAVVIALAAPAVAEAAELLVFERRGCTWCGRFEAEIAPVYEKTDEGRQAPLRRVDIDADGPPADVALAAPVRFTPTFILVDAGREIGRITGYMSDEAFWGLLGTLTERLAPAT